MKRIIVLAALGLVVGMLVPTVSVFAKGPPGKAKSPLTRPFHIWSDYNIYTLDAPLEEGGQPVHYYSVGIATPFGIWTNVGTGGHAGVLTTLNGEQITWTSTTDEDGLGFTVVQESGTGRFEGVSGGFHAVLTGWELLGQDEDDNYVYWFSYVGEGTITYANTSGKNQVERPCKVHSDLITFDYGTYVLEALGQTTHVGRTHSVGHLAGVTPTGLLMFRTVSTGPNGDQIFEQALVRTPENQISVFPDGWISVFTGGTGKFEDASGYYEAVYTYRLPPAGNPPVATFGCEGTGKVVY